MTAAFYSTFPDYRKNEFLERFLSSARLSFRQEANADRNRSGTFVEGKSEVFGENWLLCVFGHRINHKD